MVTFLMVIQFIVSFALIAAVLMQESKGEGLGSIGGGGGGMFFNQSSGPEFALQQATKYLAIVFIVLSIILSLL